MCSVNFPKEQKTETQNILVSGNATHEVLDSCVPCPAVGLPPVVGPTNRPQGLCCQLLLALPRASLCGFPWHPLEVCGVCRDAPCSLCCLCSYAGVQGLPVPQALFYDVTGSASFHMQGEHTFKVCWRCCCRKGKQPFSLCWALFLLQSGFIGGKLPCSQDPWEPYHSVW